MPYYLYYTNFNASSTKLITRLTLDGSLEDETTISYSGPECGGIDLDSDGNLYVMGANGTTATLYKYDSTVTEDWSSSFSQPGPNCVVVSANYIYATAYYGNSTTRLRQYNSDGTYNWSKDINIDCYNIWADEDDNVYMRCEQALSDNGDGRPDKNLLAYDSSGTQILNVKNTDIYNGDTGNRTARNMVGNASENRLYVGGWHGSVWAGKKYAVLGINKTTGGTSWKWYNPTTTSEGAVNLAISKDGDIYVAYQGDDQNYASLTRINNAGTYLWSNDLYPSDFGKAVACDQFGGAYIGVQGGSKSVKKYDSDNNLQWTYGLYSSIVPIQGAVSGWGTLRTATGLPLASLLQKRGERSAFSRRILFDGK